MSDNEKEIKNKVEALLFASGRLMNAETLAALVGTSKDTLTNSIAILKEEYETRDSPLMVVEEKDGWKLTVREKYLPLVRKIVSETELPKTVLETLAVIAWKAPVLQSEIIRIRHNKAYEHISELEEMGFIKKEPHGRSQMIKLAEKFYDYFDVEGGKDIRDIFSAKPTGQSKVEYFGEKPEIADEPVHEMQPAPNEKEDSSNEFSELDDVQYSSKS